MDWLVEHAVAVLLDDYSRQSLEEASAADETSPDVLTRRAMRYYLADSDSGRPGWPCSGLYKGDSGGVARLELDVDAPLWDAFREESKRQGVSTDRLARHAVLYYLADRDSGWLTRRILDGLDGSES